MISFLGGALIGCYAVNKKWAWWEIGLCALLWGVIVTVAKGIIETS
jgi:hypothetical protein